MTTKTEQVDHYNEFGRLYREQIVASASPETWTSDTNPRSPMNLQMQERIKWQHQVVKKYFDIAYPVLDLGCGFGRQSIMMAKAGFKVTGVDNSDILIDIAREIAKKKGYSADFLCDSVWDFKGEKLYQQVTLFDVVEHFKPADRRIFVRHLAEYICQPGALVIITIPYVTMGSLKDVTRNIYKSFASHFSFLSAKKEHPYPLPFRETIEKLLPPYFTLKEYLHNDDTAFFVLERNQ